VKKIKDAFEKPFRNHATSTLPSTYIAASSNTTINYGDNAKGKSKEKATSLPKSSTTNRTRPPRELSLVWDLELDLDLDVNSPESGPPPIQRLQDTSFNGKGNVDIRMDRSPSPIWDIELDLNGSDEDDSQDSKGKGKAGFGAAELL